MYEGKNEYDNLIVENESDLQEESSDNCNAIDLVEGDQTHYTISELASRLGIKSPTLRKYENDYELYIPRDELGHRFYTQEHLKVLQHILAMKAEGSNIHAIKKSINSLELMPKANLQLSASNPFNSVDLLIGIEDRITNRINEALSEDFGAMTKVFETNLLIVERFMYDREEKKFAEFEQTLLARVEAIVNSNQEEQAKVYEEKLKGMEIAIKADITSSITDLMKQLETEHEQIMDYIVDAINTLQRFIVNALKNR